MTRAAVYLRISRDLTGEGLGVARQQQDCLSLCRDLGWEVAEVYEDNDVSAYKSRPRYKQMIAAIRAGEVDAVVAWQPDRLYRRFVDLEEIVEVIEAHNVVVRTVKAGDLNLDSAYGRMVARMLSVIAMGEGELKSERWRRSWRQGREAGLPAKTGSRLFGYTRDSLVVPDEAEVARRMAADLTSGVPLLQIATWLGEEGITTTRGSVWRTGTVRQYLANPRLAGYSTLKGEIVAEGQWEPVLDRDTWETVRALLGSRRRETPPRVALLGGMILCGRCGHRLIIGKARNGRTYRCPSRPGMPGCGRVSAYAAPVEEVVETYARERLSDPRVLERAAQLSAGAGAPELLADIRALEARLVELEGQLDAPGVPVAAITRAMSRARARLEEAQGRLADVARTAVPRRYVGGAPWPETLGERRQLVALALGDDVVHLDPVGRVHNFFDPTRVRIGAPS